MLRNRLSATTLAASTLAGLAAWLSLGRLAVTDAESVRRIGVLPPWLLATLVAAAIVVAVATRLCSRTSLPLFLSGLIVL